MSSSCFQQDCTLLSGSDWHSTGQRHATWSALFAGALCFVGGVSAYDGYLVVRTGEVIQEFEKNPMGTYLIEYNHGDPSLFLQLKAAGTVTVLFILSVMHRRSHRLASPVAFALVIFQAGLLIFLENPL